MKKKLSKIVLCSVLAFSSLYAKEKMELQIDTEQNKISDADLDKNFNDESLDTWISDFESKMNVSIGEAKKGRTFFSGTASVRGNAMSPSYAKELSIAYEKALLDLQANFILQTYGTMSTERISDYFEDDSTNAREFDKKEVDDLIKKRQLNTLLGKFIAVISNELDAKLREQGVPLSDISKMSLTQKKTLFKDNFKKEMVKKAVQSISGLVPIQTKIITVDTPAGKAVQLGVIAVISQKTTQFAKDISKRRTTHVKGTPKNIRDVLPQNKSEYLNEFGLRYLYDEEGRPMLISYGRWSVLGKTKDPNKYLRKVKSAKEKARMFAESYIGEFMKSNIEVAQSITAESVSEEIATKVTEFNSSGERSESEQTEDIGETIDKSFKKIRAKSQFKLRGTSQLKTWQQKDENGILHVGSVVTWTYSQLENANNIASKKFRSDKEIKKQASSTTSIQSRNSKIVNDLNDF